jgi:hypothetical protein
MAPFWLYFQHQGVLKTPLRMLHYSRAAARCNNRSLVANDPWFLGTCRLRPPRISAGAGPTDEPSLPRDSAELALIAGAKTARVPSGVLQRSCDRDRDPVSRSGVGVSERANLESLPRQLR